MEATTGSTVPSLPIALLLCWEQVKRVVCTEEASESSLVHGVVFRKNVVHRRMRSAIAQPRILLLRGSLEFERTNSKLSSLNTSLDQASPCFPIKLWSIPCQCLQSSNLLPTKLPFRTLPNTSRLLDLLNDYASAAMHWTHSIKLLGLIHCERMRSGGVWLLSWCRPTWTVTRLPFQRQFYTAIAVPF